MTRLNVSLANPDPELQAVQSQIRPDRLTLVNDALGPVSVDSAGAANPGCAIDLIAHSMEGIEYLASWVIDADDSTGSTLRADWPNGTPTDFRLLACNTAASSAALAAMQRLQSELGVTVYGTTGPIYADDFGPDGFISDDVLVSADDASLSSARLTSVQIDAWFQRFVPSHLQLGDVLPLASSTLAEIMAVQKAAGATWPIHTFASDDLDTMLRNVDPEARLAPGLLAVPDGDAIFQIGADAYQRVSFLLGGAFVRVYTAAQPMGFLFRANGPVQLAGGTAVTAAEQRIWPR